ncbi:hypothetical protein ACMHYB_25860 [Sorangium sp. So ce1128]
MRSGHRRGSSNGQAQVRGQVMEKLGVASVVELARLLDQLQGL